MRISDWSSDVCSSDLLSKPAEQTCLIAAAAVSILHRAGVPAGAVQLLPGRGESVGAALIASPVVRGVMFTGSTDVALLISRQLADRLDDAGHPIDRKSTRLNSSH